MDDNTHLAHFDNIAEDRIRQVGEQRRIQRSDRRAAAVNAVVMARTHANRNDTDFTTDDSDIIVAIQDLLDRVAGS